MYTLLHSSGLGIELQLLDQHTAGELGDEPLSSISGMEPISLGNALRGFYHSLATLSDSTAQRLDRLQVLQLRHKLSKEISAKVLEAYARLHAAVMAPSSGYADPDLILLYSPQKLATMLEF